MVSQNVYYALSFLLDNIFIRFGTKLYRKLSSWDSYGHLLCSQGCRFIPVCYERDLMMSLSDDKQADSIDDFNTTSRYWMIF